MSDTISITVEGGAYKRLGVTVIKLKYFSQVYMNSHYIQISQKVCHLEHVTVILKKKIRNKGQETIINS